MKKRVYIETTVVSYLAARRSRDLVVAAHQQITEDWWQTRRSAFDAFASQAVVTEAAAGNPQLAASRLRILDQLELLEITDQGEALAGVLLSDGLVPTKAAGDALHIALATVHGMDFLLTWNCRHIANAEIRGRLLESVGAQGYELPVICTPEELAGDQDVE